MLNGLNEQMSPKKLSRNKSKDFIRVTSWIAFVFMDEERSTKSHELNTKLVTTEVAF